MATLAKLESDMSYDRVVQLIGYEGKCKAPGCGGI